MIQKESGRNFRSFCNNQGKEDNWSLTIRLLKDAPHRNPPATLKSGPHFTESSKETAENLLHHFYPDDTPDTLYVQKRVRANVRLADGADEPDFTEAEVQESFESMDSNKAPGLDHLTSDICSTFFKSYPALLTLIFNRFWTSDIFPQAGSSPISEFSQNRGKTITQTCHPLDQSDSCLCSAKSSRSCSSSDLSTGLRSSDTGLVISPDSGNRHQRPTP